MEIIIYIIIGFLAQMIDGMLGMGYGVSCRTFLSIFLKTPTSISSALVHYAELPSSFTSMLCHIKLKNVDKKVFLNLVIPGVIGSLIGAYLITIDLSIIEILIDIYLIIIGIVIISKAFKKNHKKKIYNKNNYLTLGFLGGFFDASGGGGYGPIVTGTLVANNDDVKKTIGTVNASEFFVTLASSIMLLLMISNIKEYLLVVIGLMIGGVIASPVAAKLCLKIKKEKMFILVGLLLIICNIYNLYTIIN